MELYNKLKSSDPFIIAGPCVMESEDMCLEIAKTLDSICKNNGFTYIFKASFDKANRTSLKSFRGPGIKEGFKIMSKVKEITEYTTTDIHLPWHSKFISPVVDILQIPAFLCRQTDLIISAAETQKIVNIKKAQFLSPEKMNYVAEKIKLSGNRKILLTERGTSFGPDNLVVDFRNIIKMKKENYPIIIDCTHSSQEMISGSGITGGNREYASYFAKTGLIWGCSGVFAEVHPNPSSGLSDAANMIDYKTFEKLLKDLRKLKNANLC